uniref:Uncharacterized protein n=1 Tax=Moniliophthora roreri TaxID=221103 RepID=A0A0W0G057_MONRR
MTKDDLKPEEIRDSL